MKSGREHETGEIFILQQGLMVFLNIWAFNHLYCL